MVANSPKTSHVAVKSPRLQTSSLASVCRPMYRQPSGGRRLTERSRNAK